MEILYRIRKIDEPDPKEGLNISDEEEPQLVKLTLLRLDSDGSVIAQFPIEAYGWETSTREDVMHFSGFTKPRGGKSVRFVAEKGHKDEGKNTLKAEDDLEPFEI